MFLRSSSIRSRRAEARTVNIEEQGQHKCLVYEHIASEDILIQAIQCKWDVRQQSRGLFNFTAHPPRLFDMETESPSLAWKGQCQQARCCGCEIWVTRLLHMKDLHAKYFGLKGTTVLRTARPYGDVRGLIDRRIASMRFLKSQCRRMWSSHYGTLKAPFLRTLLQTRLDYDPSSRS